MVCEHMLRESRPEVPLCFLMLLGVIVIQGGFYYILGRILPAHTPDAADQDRCRGTAGSLRESSPAVGRGDAVTDCKMVVEATCQHPPKVILNGAGASKQSTGAEINSDLINRSPAA